MMIIEKQAAMLVQNQCNQLMEVMIVVTLVLFFSNANAMDTSHDFLNIS